jgi:hypothetical protein
VRDDQQAEVLRSKHAAKAGMGSMSIWRWLRAALADEGNLKNASIDALGEEFTLELHEGVWTLPLTPLGEGRYRVDALPGGDAVPGDEDFILYHDIIQTGITEHPRRLRFIRVLERSQEMLDLLIHRDFFDRADLRALLHWVTEQGGCWALDMGAVLLVSLPSQAKVDFLSEYGRIVDAYNRSLER